LPLYIIIQLGFGVDNYSNLIFMEKILIVDDSKTVCEMLGEMTQSLGYNCETAEDGFKALNWLENERFSVVIADIELPGIDGLSLIKMVKEKFPEIDVITITGFGNKYSYSEVIKAGASDFIIKPFGIEELAAKLSRVFRERQIKEELEEKNAELLRLSINDDLTGLYNRRHFYTQLEKEITRARRQKHSLFLIMFDLDDFKKFNDQYGHLEGDRILQEIGKAIKRSIRNNVDAGFRYGGDEFAIIIPEANQVQAIKIAQRIQEACRNITPWPVEISLGLVELKEKHDIESLVRCADQLMYQAKDSPNKIKISNGNGK